MAHRVEDAGGEEPVVGGVGEREGLDEVALGEPVEAGVVGHPRGELGRLAGRREQRAADRGCAARPQQSGQVGAQVLDEGAPGVRTAERAVEPVERVTHRAQPLDVRDADARRSAVLVERVLGADEPGHGGAVPGGDVERCLDQRGRVGEVAVEELGDGASALLGILRVGEARVG